MKSGALVIGKALTCEVSRLSVLVMAHAELDAAPHRALAWAALAYTLRSQRAVLDRDARSGQATTIAHLAGDAWRAHRPSSWAESR